MEKIAIETGCWKTLKNYFSLLYTNEYENLDKLDLTK